MSHTKSPEPQRNFLIISPKSAQGWIKTKNYISMSFLLWCGPQDYDFCKKKKKLLVIQAISPEDSHCVSPVLSAGIPETGMTRKHPKLGHIRLASSFRAKKNRYYSVLLWVRNESHFTILSEVKIFFLKVGPESPTYILLYSCNMFWSQFPLLQCPLYLPHLPNSMPFLFSLYFESKQMKILKWSRTQNNKRKHEKHTPKLKQTNKQKAPINTKWETRVYRQKISRKKK